MILNLNLLKNIAKFRLDTHHILVFAKLEDQPLIVLNQDLENQSLLIKILIVIKIILIVFF